MATITSPLNLRVVYSPQFIETWTNTFGESGRLDRSPQPGYVTFAGSRTRTNTPGWSTLIAEGRGVTNPYSLDATKFEASPTTSSVVTRTNRLPSPPWSPNQNLTTRRFHMSGVFDIGGAYLRPLAHLPLQGKNPEQIALAKLYQRIREDQQHWSGLTFLGELREAGRMIKRPAKALFDGLGDWLLDVNKTKGRYRFDGHRRVESARARAKRLKALNSAIAGSWLEASFGWAPLLSDVKSAAETIGRWETEVRRTRVTAKASRESSIAYPPTAAFDVGSGACRCFFTTTRVTTHGARYVAGLNNAVNANFASAQRLVELSGFRISEFVPTLWELTPWSWLVDYFTNIGDLLEYGVTDMSGITWISLSERTQTVNTVDGVHSPRDQGITWSMTGSVTPQRTRTIRTTFSRQKVTSLPLPKLYFENPFGKPLKVANMLAVLSQKISSIRAR